MRSIWKGSISFGLVNVPVKLYGATEEHDIPSHQVHAADSGRIKYRRVCEDCGEVVDFGDIAKSYQHEDHDVVVTKADIATITEEQNKTIDVLEFVPAGDIDPMMLDKPYFLGPEKGAGKAYALFARVLTQTDRVAIVQFAMRSRTRLAALRVLPKEGVIVAHTLRWPDEVRTPGFPVEDVPVKEAELEMAEKLVETMVNEFNPDRYRDSYREQLQELIATKAGGGVIAAEAETVGEADISDMLAKLEASIANKVKVGAK